MRFPFHDTIIYFHQIIDMIEDTEALQDRINILKKYGDVKFRQFLRLQFDDNIKFIDPEREVVYKIEESINVRGRSLEKEIDTLSMFIEYKGSPLLNVSEDKRHRVFEHVVERLDPEEASLLLRVRTKNLETDRLSKELVEAVFPSAVKTK